MYKTLVRATLSILLLSSLALGGYDLSGGVGAQNLSMSQFMALGIDEEAVAATGAPVAEAVDQGGELAAYTENAPPESDLGKVLPFDIDTYYPMYIFYDGGYLGWNEFISVFPSIQPGLWVERAAGWSWYAALPLGGWTQELIYLPKPSPVTLYEIYPGGFVRAYYMGPAQAGYHLIWYYADSPGRHMSILATSSGYSNVVVVDVPAPAPQPSPREECESRSTSTQICEWRDGRCQCHMRPAPNPVAECEERGCQWYDGGCHCEAPDPREECERNPQCDYVNGNCYCRGLNPEPSPAPVPDPVAECEANPTCHWSDGRCYCMGFNPGGDSFGSDDYTVA